MTLKSIIGLQKVNSDEEATTLMLNIEYELTLAVFLNNEKRAIRILDNINYGTNYWNCR
jgi:acyl-CoA reductase-like NAD-dependent aldehyde dehydrogenase